MFTNVVQIEVDEKVTRESWQVLRKGTDARKFKKPWTA